MTTTTTSSGPLKVLSFIVLQLLVLGGGVAWCGLQFRQWQLDHAFPAVRPKPINVPPLYDYSVVVSDEQLVRVLTKLRPKFLAEKTKINHVDHGLRFWGIPARFHEPTKYLDGNEMRRILVDHKRFAEVYGENAKPLLIDHPGGVRVRVAEGHASSSHTDHTLAGLAEVGTHMNEPLHVKRGDKVITTSYRAMFERAIRDFSLNQVEYEWSTMAFALFTPPVNRWYSSEGQEITYDRLARRIMRQELPQGVCFGNHRLYTLVILLRIDEDETPILSPEVREEVLTFLADMTPRLVRHQHADGYWDGDWATRAASESKADKTSGDMQADRILATGHALEWWAMVPRSVAERLHPPRSTLVSAGQWLVRTIENLSDEQVEGYFTYLSHCGRALALWRNQFAYEVALDPNVPAIKRMAP